MSALLAQRRADIAPAAGAFDAAHGERPAQLALLGTGTVGSAVLARLQRWQGTAFGRRMQLVHVANSRRAVGDKRGVALRAPAADIGIASLVAKAKRWVISSCRGRMAMGRWRKSSAISPLTSVTPSPCAANAQAAITEWTSSRTFGRRPTSKNISSISRRGARIRPSRISGTPDSSRSAITGFSASG